MGAKADLHRSVLREDYVHAARHKVRIDGPTSAIEGKSSANRTGVSQQGDDGAREPQTGTTPYCCSPVIRLPRRGPVDSTIPIEVQRCGRQKDLDGWHGVAALGRYRMGAAFGIEPQVTPRRGVDSLQAGLNLVTHAGGKFELPKRKPELPIPPEMSGRNCFRDDPV